jgi:hypothetical protein
MIPRGMTQAHVLKAIKEADQRGVPLGRSLRKFALIHEGKMYPPKHVLARAAFFATGRELHPSDFDGGRETNEFLKRLGFEIRRVGKDRPSNATAPAAQPPQMKELLSEAHDQRCSECKDRIHEMLRVLYGQAKVVRAECKLALPHKLEDYSSQDSQKPYVNKLHRVFQALANHRGFRKFARGGSSLSADIFVDPPGFMVELDESQHFTLPRAIALENYPEDLDLGFDAAEWLRLSRQMARHDPNPEYRDEQRAWYDTLRDFAFLLSDGVHLPTVRIRMGSYPWCKLDPDNPQDVLEFRRRVGHLPATPAEAGEKKSFPSTGVTDRNHLVQYLRHVEWYLQEVRLLYLLWITEDGFKPPSESVGGLGAGGDFTVVCSPKGRAFTLSPCGPGAVYCGGGHGTVKMPPDCYPRNQALQERTRSTQQNLSSEMKKVRCSLLELVNAGNLQDCWGYLQDFYWIKLGIHEFAFDLSFLNPSPPDSVRGILLKSMQNGVDLRLDHCSRDLPVQDLKEFIRHRLTWNRYACCAFDSGPIAIGRNGFVRFSEFARHRALFEAPLLASEPELREWAKGVLKEHYDILLSYDEPPIAEAHHFDVWRQRRTEIRRKLAEVEEKLQRYRSLLPKEGNGRSC